LFEGCLAICVVADTGLGSEEVVGISGSLQLSMVAEALALAELAETGTLVKREAGLIEEDCFFRLTGLLVDVDAEATVLKEGRGTWA
jgi:hypothetical protein